MEFRTNCKNCGAPLNYDRSDYGKVAKCSYCGTEYHVDLSGKCDTEGNVDLLGKIEGYRVKLEFMGKTREYYIGDWELKPLVTNAYRNSDWKLTTSAAPIYKSVIKLIEI